MLKSSNTAAGDVGGIYISGGMAAIYDSLVLDNQAGGCCRGIHVGNAAWVTITGTQLISNGAAYAGGIGLFSSSALTIEQSTLHGNSSPDGSGGAFELSGDLGTPVVLNLHDVILSHNLTRDHGAAISATQAVVHVENGLMYANQSTSGNANVIAMGESDFTIMNSIITENNPSGAQAVIVWSGGVFTMTNSVMWNNALSLQGDPPCPTCFSVTFSDIGGGWPGTGNVDLDPLFRDPGNQDYHLTFFSPLIDAGTSVGAPLRDLDGILRDGSPDMGAYEFSELLVFLPATVKEYIP